MYIPKLTTSQIRYHRCLDKFQLATHTQGCEGSAFNIYKTEGRVI